MIWFWTSFTPSSFHFPPSGRRTPKPTPHFLAVMRRLHQRRRRKCSRGFVTSTICLLFPSEEPSGAAHTWDQLKPIRLTVADLLPSRHDGWLCGHVTPRPFLSLFNQRTCGGKSSRESLMLQERVGLEGDLLFELRSVIIGMKWMKALISRLLMNLFINNPTF